MATAEHRASSIYSVRTFDATYRVRAPVTNRDGDYIPIINHTHPTDGVQASQDLAASYKALISDGSFTNPAPVRDACRNGRRPSRHTEDGYNLGTTCSQRREATGHQRPLSSPTRKTPMRVMLRDGSIRSANERSKIRSFDMAAYHKKDQATQTVRSCQGKAEPLWPTYGVLNESSTPIRATERRYVIPDGTPDLPARRPSLVRKLSDSVKGAFRRRPSIDKRAISKPSQFQDYHPNHQNRQHLHSEVKAVPLVDAQYAARFNHSVGSTGNYQSAMPLRRFASEKVHETPNRDPRGLDSRASTGRVVRRKPAFAYPNKAADVSSQRKVVGDPERGMLFGDFIEATDSAAQTNISSVVANTAMPLPSVKPQYSQPKLVPKPLQLSDTKVVAEYKRSASLRKRVDTSAKSWMPPEPRERRSTLISDGYEIDANAPKYRQMNQRTWSDLFDPEDYLLDPVEDIIDDYAGGWDSQDSWSGDDSLGLTAYSSEFGTIRIRDDTPRETFVDMYDRGSHCSWIATRRGMSMKDSHSDFDRYNETLYDQYMRPLASCASSVVSGDEYGYI